MISFKKRSVPPKNRQTLVLDEDFWTWYSDSLKNEQLKEKEKEPKYYIFGMNAMKLFFDNDKLYPPFQTQLQTSLRTAFTDKDITRSFEFIRYFQLAEEGLFISNSNVDKRGSQLSLKGADNWNNVMCYMDALLFAMFAKLESFEPILFINQKDEKIKKLATLLRVYVSMLRSGQSITIDITKRICEVLKNLGFSEAMSQRQEDCAPLFQFLTEVLSMPLLTLKIDIAHGGKFNKLDDHKFTKERILFVSIPDQEERKDNSSDWDSIDKADKLGNASEMYKSQSPADITIDGNDDSAASKKSQGTLTTDSNSENIDKNELTDSENEQEDVILLEECLEHYFNNSVEVKRELGRRATLESLKRSDTRTSVDIDAGTISYIDEIPENVDKLFPTDEQIENIGSAPISKSNSHANSHPSSHIYNVEESVEPSIQSDSQDSEWNSITGSFQSQTSPLVRRKTTSGTKVNSPSLGKIQSTLISTRERSSTLSIWSINKSKEVTLPAWMFLQLLPFYTDDNNEKCTTSSKEFVERRPVLPICLKRYSYSSEAKRSSKKIIIPPFINLPKFIADDESEEPYGNFRLVLESAVCHRGNSINSGHYVSVVRRDNIVSDFEQEENKAVWLLYDDMKKTKVTEKTFAEIFNTEWPYMLFYRMVPFEDKSRKNFVVPEGSKTSYWKDDLDKDSQDNLDTYNSSVTETLIPVKSNAQSHFSRETHVSDSPTISENTVSKLKKSHTISHGHHHQSILFKQANPSISASDFESYPNTTYPLPSDSKYIDIRNRYYWYIIDNDNNYLKEPYQHIVIRKSSSKDTVNTGTVSPQFRRNSQWSNNSNMSHLNVNVAINILPEDQQQSSLPSKKSEDFDEKKVEDEFKKLSVSSNGSTGSFWRRNKTKSKKHSPSNSNTDLGRVTSNPEISVTYNDSFLKPVVPIGAKTVLESSTDANPKKRFKKGKKLKKGKKDAYKQEKCIIM